MPPRTAVRHLTPADLSERLGGLSLNTLADWRKKRRGPAFIRSESTGDNATILYPLAEVEAWEKRQLVKTDA